MQVMTQNTDNELVQVLKEYLLHSFEVEALHFHFFKPDLLPYDLQRAARLAVQKYISCENAKLFFYDNREALILAQGMNHEKAAGITRMMIRELKLAADHYDSQFSNLREHAGWLLRAIEQRQKKDKRLKRDSLCGEPT